MTIAHRPRPAAVREPVRSQAPQERRGRGGRVGGEVGAAHRLVDDGDELAGDVDAGSRALLVGQRSEGAAEERADVEGDAVGRLGGAEVLGARLEVDIA